MIDSVFIDGLSFAMPFSERGVPPRMKLQFDRKQRPMLFVSQLSQPRRKHLQSRLDIIAGAVGDQIAQKHDLVLDMSLQNLDQQIVLACKIRIEGPLRMTRCTTDVADRHGGNALLDYRGMGGRDQPVAGLALRVFSRRPHGVTLHKSGTRIATITF